MKKLLMTSGIYTACALVFGVFFREFTKFYGFTEHTTLSVIHTHLFILGTFLFLILALFLKDEKIDNSKMVKRFFLSYNIAFPLFISTLFTRGVIQVVGIEISSSINKMISGLAGLTHILLTVSLCLLIPIFIKITKREEIK